MPSGKYIQQHPSLLVAFMVCSAVIQDRSLFTGTAVIARRLLVKFLEHDLAPLTAMKQSAASQEHAMVQPPVVTMAAVYHAVHVSLPTINV